MKRLILLLVLFAVTACTNPEKKPASPANKPSETNHSVSAETTQKIDESANESANESGDKFVYLDRHQDSLRTLLLESKPNESLKSSVLQELYIRGLVKEDYGKIHFYLPLNLHSLDCGAPDCYTTDIHFQLEAGAQLQFPPKVVFTLRESGCIDEETEVQGTFELQEATTNHLHYYSPGDKSSLVIFKTDERRQYLYYFAGVEPGEVSADKIGLILAAGEEEDSGSKVPYRSTLMVTSEYERFLN